MNSAVTVADNSIPHRLDKVTLTVRDADGNPCPGARVEVEQLSHSFGFSNIGFDFLDLANGKSDDPARDQALANQWLQLFNFVTLPFYWRDFEPEEGRPRTAELRATAQWFADRGIRVKGHPLMWHTLAPKWLLGRSMDQVEATQRARIRRDVGDFAGLIDVFDAINEVVIMPVFTAETNAITPLAQDKGRLHVIRLAFEEARAANKNVKLLLNDFDLSTAYECLIEAVLEADIHLDALGLQTHMHQGYWGESKMTAMVDRFARYGLPIHMTETSLVSGHLMPPEIVDLNDYQVPSWPSTPDGEARQADEIVRHYRSLVAHPAIRSINYWGISDRGAWLGAPIGLIRADGTAKPAFDALHSLIKGDWWIAPTTLVADSQGEIQVTGFLGEYRLTAPSGTTTFRLGPLDTLF
jgi:GH35 family endo-1,4-beta-xylanase